MDNTRGKIPVIIGITGHRDLRDQDIGNLKCSIRNELESLQKKCPHSEIIVLTSRAEGADQLCAETALEMGLEVIYGREGIYIAEHCHILMAVWDGSMDDGEDSGTAAVVQARLRNLTSGSAGEQLRRADGAVIQIVAPRAGSANTEPEAGTVIVHGDVSISDSILRDTDNYNKDCESISCECVSEDKIEEVYTASDRLSIINDEKDRKVLIGLSACATALTIAFLLYDEAEWHWMIILCGLMIISLFGINAITRWTRFNAKYVEYRILAEACRVQTYLRTAGINHEVTEIMPWNLQITVPWISRAMSALMTGEEAGEKKSILNTWITDQRDYHLKALKRTETQLKRNDRLVTTALVITIATYAAALLYEIACVGIASDTGMFTPEFNNSVRTGFKLCMGIFAAVTLFANNYYGRLALPNVIDDHRKMALLYEEAEREITDKGEEEALLLRIAEDELCENANWYAYQSKHDEGLGI